MVYINSRGEVVDNKALSWSTPLEMILAFFNFIYVFFQTLLPIGEPSNRSSRGRGNGGGWGRPGGGGGGGPKGPRIRTLGSCGGPNAPPAGG